jgi:nucleoid DNA-binding protein
VFKVAEKTRLPKTITKEIIETFLEVISEEVLEKQNMVRFSGFGIFSAQSTQSNFEFNEKGEKVRRANPMVTNRLVLRKGKKSQTTLPYDFNAI